MLVFALLLVSQMIHKSVTNKISKTFICVTCQILSADKYEPLWIYETIDKSCGKCKTKEYIVKKFRFAVRRWHAIQAKKKVPLCSDNTSK